MQRSKADSKKDHQSFIERVIAAEEVWGLKGESGFAWCESNEVQERDVILFWSERAFSESPRKLWYPEYEPVALTLFDFLFRWLPGMSSDGVLAGTNWTQELVGVESDPKELQDEIGDQMPKDMLDRYFKQLKRVIAGQAAREENEGAI